MSRQAIVGLFTILGLIALFVVYFILSDLATKASGYEIGIHFGNASGLTRGALVYESGVQVGTVSRINLLDDFSVEVIVALRNNVDIPRNSQFVISAPLTGSSTLTIVPPRVSREKVALLPRQILPIDQQPKGANPVSVQDLLEAGRGELVKFDKLLTDLTNREPVLMAQLQSAISNANELSTTANGMIQKFSVHADQLTATLQTSLNSASANIVDLTDQLNTTVKRNGGKIDTLLGSLNRTSASLEGATASLRQMATNPELQGNLLATTRQIAATTKNITDITADLRSMTSDPNTQGQLKNTVANMDAATQRLNSLLGSFGGTSSVYGVDPGATPVPAGSPGTAPAAPGGPGAPVPAATPSGRRSGSNEFRLSPQMRSRLGELAKSLIEVQVRLSEFATKPNPKSTANPLLPPGRGPQSDFNIVVLPRGDTHLLTGVNDLGGTQTWNFAMAQRFAPGVRLGAGILYSRLGVMADVRKGLFGFEARAYDPKQGYVDSYIKARAMKNLELFAGERDIFHPERRTVYGLQYEFFGGR